MGAPNFGSLPAALLNTVKGMTVRYAVWPALAGTGAVGSGCAKIVSGNGAWGALADIVAAKDIATDFWICALVFGNFAPGVGQYDIQVFDATPAVLCDAKVDLTLATANLDPWKLPFPIYMVANAQVQAWAGDNAGGGNIYLGILYGMLL